MMLWSRRRDLNPRPTHYECVALPLSYPGNSGILPSPTCDQLQCWTLPSTAVYQSAIIESIGSGSPS